MALSDAKISAVWFLLCLVAKRYILQQKYLKKWTGSAVLLSYDVQLLIPYTDPERHKCTASKIDRQSIASFNS